jgi:hypothetical protein
LAARTIGHDEEELGQGFDEKGSDAIRPFFQALIAEFGKPDSSFRMKLQSVAGKMTPKD